MWQKFKNCYHLISAFLAAVYFRFPSRKIYVIGVTGTDGKTTTTNMIFHILEKNAKKASMISSVNAQIGNKKYETGFHVTTPNSWQVQKYLRRALNSGSEYFVLESTSHGLDQNRLAFISFNLGVLTNVSHEHLDYHKTWENYAKSKLKLLKKAKNVILNKDDKSYLFIKDKIGTKTVTYSLKTKADFNLKNTNLPLSINGDFNKSNALASLAAAEAVGIGKTNALSGLKSFKGVVGRLEEVRQGQNFRIIIDFAHTPNSIKNVLSYLKSLKSDNSALIVVFGSAGQRDKTKRPKMGYEASQYADLIVLTSEDPRNENAGEICMEIAKGIKNKKIEKDYFIIENRQKAIEFAFKKAKKGDIAAILGKGHEKSMTIGKKEYQWSDFKAAQKAVLKLK